MSQTYDVFHPQQAVFGGSWRLDPRLLVNFDMTWVDWSAYEPFDDVAVGDPHAVLDTSALGRRILRVYYAGTNRIGLWALSQAARHGSDGALERAYGPVLGNSYTPKAPSVVFFDGFTLLYFTAPATKSKPGETTAIGIGVAPATVSLAL